MAAMWFGKLPPPFVVLLVVCLAWAQPARAQRVAYRIGGTTTSYGVVDLATGVSVPATADEAQVEAVFTSDGQYAVKAEAGAVVLRHMPTGAQTVLPVDFRPVVVHPRRPMLFGYTGSFELARLDARGFARWTPCPGVTTVWSFDISIDGQQLFVACQSDEIVVLDTETGGEVRRLASVPTAIRFLAVNAAGELVAFRSTGPTMEVARLDAQTGQVLASRAALPSWVRTGSRFQLMEFNCAVSPGSPCQYRLVDAATLGVSRHLPGGTPFFARVFVSPDGREVVFNDAGFAYAPSRAVRLDVATGQVLNDATMGTGDTITVNYTPGPLPPAAPAATVADNTVTLSWRLPAESPQATGYRLDIGSSSGASNLGSVSLGPAQTFTGAGVPPGRYYVRVRAENYAGLSAASAEVVIDVP